MRILQLIDSLRPGGAEQMAVAYANALSRRGCKSYLCSTRMEGLLKKHLEPEVGYLFLEKKHTLDRRAFLKLRNYVREERIELIQAHSSSCFLAVSVKLAVPGIKLVWHDHYGKELKQRKIGGLKWMSGYFDGVISVNEGLKDWALEHLKCSRVVFIRNFLGNSSFDRLRMTSFDKLRMTSDGSFDRLRMTTRAGESSDKLRMTSFDRLRMTGGADLVLKGVHKNKIICVANLRPQKDHMTLLKAFELVLKADPDVSLHLVGKDEGNAYSETLKSYVEEHSLQDHVFFYGEQEQVEVLIAQATLGVLSSSSEGLPVALLEYGRAGIPVVCTEVGEIPAVLGSLGKMVEAGHPQALGDALLFYLTNEEKREQDALLFQNKVVQEFSEDVIVPKVLDFHSSLLKMKGKPGKV